MATFQIRSAPLPSNFRGTPQQLLEAMLDRIQGVSDSEDFAFGGDMPTTNVGPWLKNGTQWYVWNDGSEPKYIPLDLSASLNSNEIFVGEVPPDTTTTQDFPKVWLKVTGITVLGLYYWFGSTAGWVTVASELQPNSITNLMIQDGVITTEKVADLAVTINKFAPNIPLTKLARGGFSQFLRMNSSGSAIQWQPLVAELVADFTTDLKQIIVVPHGLPKTPNYVRVCLKSMDTDHGFNPFDEIDMSFGFNAFVSDPDFGASTVDSFWKANATDIVIYLHQRPRIYAPPSWASFTPDPSVWSLKIYAAVG